jgi:hypothetical protein
MALINVHTGKLI